MKKLIMISTLALVFILSACAQGGFDESKNITVYTRDTTSGTRTGFMEGIDFDEAAELMLYDMASKQEKQNLTADIIKQIGLMDNLLKDMLELSRLETKPKTKQDSINLKHLLEQTIEQLTTFIHEKHIKVKLTTEEILYSCEASDIRSLFKNLIENAVKYNVNERKIDITLTQDNQFVIFIIKDTGIGIPKTQQTRIFERFYQVDKTRSKMLNGTGLGLAIVKHVVSYYEGTINLDSEPNHGAIFTIKLKK